jgi:predicted esterase
MRHAPRFRGIARGIVPGGVVRSFAVLGLLLAVFLPLLLTPEAHGQGRYKAVRDPQSPAEIPYTRYFTKDKFGRRITFYVHGDQAKKLPLVVSVLGSGAYSNFIRVNGEIRDGHRAAREAFSERGGERAHVVIVEKPGIAFLEQHGPQGNANGTAVGASQEFLRENTLDRWTEAVNAALLAARALPLADKSRTLLIGHSEGATVAALLAAQSPFVTHVASLSGNGPSVLFELMTKAREGRLYTDMQGDAEVQVTRLLAEVAAVRADPSSDSKLMLGHSYRYWSSRWPVSTMDALAHTKARIFLAHGTADRNVTVAHFDMMYAHLLARGMDVTARRVEGADHGYRFAEQPQRGNAGGTPALPQRDGWREIFGAVSDWFFQ